MGEVQPGDGMPKLDKKAYELMRTGHVATEVAKRLGMTNRDVWDSYEYWCGKPGLGIDADYEKYHEPDVVDLMSFETLEDFGINPEEVEWRLKEEYAV